MLEKKEFGDAEAYVAEGSSDEAVLYLSGWRDYAVYHDRVPEAMETFVDSGFSVLAAPYRGLLDQPGEFSFDSMVDDALEYAEMLKEYAGTDRITAVGNCIGGLAAFTAASESDLVKRMVSINTLFGFRDEDWWTSDYEYEKRTRRWPMIEMGAEGPLGTEFRGLDEEFYKEEVCRCQPRLDLTERLDDFADKPIYMMVSYSDKKIDPLHTWTMYRYIRNWQAGRELNDYVEIDVLTEPDPMHTMYIDEDEPRKKTIKWMNQTDS